ncbi:MAG: (4Fe-4S)-binding protein [Peptococcaceae bacterium]|nr:(4Fe-4S)-binding protein [Peptococcaceae bacterium]
MIEITVISGKGGTGKTSLVASLTSLAPKPAVADCDVDAADLHLVLDPQVKESHDFSGGKLAEIIPAKCNSCGKCYELCRFGAVIKNENKKPAYAIDPISCEGCGVCSYFCPEKAIAFEPAINGQWYISETRYGPMVHAKLGIAEENSGKLVALVRDQAKKIAENKNLSYVIVDGPPGIGCPVIASVTGTDYVLIVTEPTLSGEHDLARVMELVNYFKIPAFLCLNKHDINPAMSDKIENLALNAGIKVVGRIRYDRAVTEAQIKKLPLVEFTDAPVATDLKNVWNTLIHEINLLQKGSHN